MSIKEQLLDIVADCEKPANKVNIPKLAAKLATLTADLMDDDLIVTEDDMSSLNADIRKMALQGLIYILAQTLQSK